MVSGRILARVGTRTELGISYRWAFKAKVSMVGRCHCIRHVSTSPLLLQVFLAVEYSFNAAFENLCVSCCLGNILSAAAPLVCPSEVVVDRQIRAVHCQHMHCENIMSLQYIAYALSKLSYT